VVQTPYQLPTANAHAERFVRSIKEECLDRMILLGERHFRQVVTEFAVHHWERNHQALENVLIALSANRHEAVAFIIDTDASLDCSTTTGRAA